MKVLICSDCSDAGKHVLQEAKKITATMPGAELYVYSVIDMAVVSASGLYSNAEVITSLQEQANQVGVWANEIFAGDKVNFLTETGYPAERIIQYAATLKADLLILGTHGKTGLGRLLIGSVAENVIRHVSCNTLIVPVKQIKDGGA